MKTILYSLCVLFSLSCSMGPIAKNSSSEESRSVASGLIVEEGEVHLRHTDRPMKLSDLAREIAERVDSLEDVSIEKFRVAANPAVRRGDDFVLYLFEFNGRQNGLRVRYSCDLSLWPSSPPSPRPGRIFRQASDRLDIHCHDQHPDIVERIPLADLGIANTMAPD